MARVTFDEQSMVISRECRSLVNQKCIISPTLRHPELYDPVTGTFSATASMMAIRARHTATLLDNGNVLIAGGGIGGDDGDFGRSP